MRIGGFVGALLLTITGAAGGASAVADENPVEPGLSELGAGGVARSLTPEIVSAMARVGGGSEIRMEDISVVAEYLMPLPIVADAYIASAAFAFGRRSGFEAETGIDITGTGATVDGSVLVYVSKDSDVVEASAELASEFPNRNVIVKPLRMVPFTAIAGGDSLGIDDDAPGTNVKIECTKGYTMSRPWTNGGKLFYALTAGHCDYRNIETLPDHELRHNDHLPEFVNVDNISNCRSGSSGPSNADAMLAYLGGTTSSTQSWPLAAKNTKVKWLNQTTFLVSQKTISSVDDTATFDVGNTQFSGYGIGPSHAEYIQRLDGWNGTLFAWITWEFEGYGNNPPCDFYFTRVIDVTAGYSCPGDSGAPVYGRYANGTVSAMGIEIGAGGSHPLDSDLCVDANNGYVVVSDIEIIKATMGSNLNVQVACCGP